MPDALSLDELLRLARNYPPPPRFIAGNVIVARNFIDRLCPPSSRWEPGPFPGSTIGGIRVEENPDLPAWAFAIDKGPEILVYDIHNMQGIGVTKAAVALPGQDATAATIAFAVGCLRIRREQAQKIGDSPSLSRGEPTGPGLAPSLAREPESMPKEAADGQ